MLLTEKAKKIKAPHDANNESSRIGMKLLITKGEFMKWLRSEIRKTGRNSRLPITF
jgi:hypothetical protein